MSGIASASLCWPIIRHIRYFYAWRVMRHYDHWRELGYLPVNVESDQLVLDKIWRGEL
ncbi:hypothetical protein [Bradyrhizobium sp. AS23.2]|uniref:hypothetical protein n=1 Tax=Bradyrhizobium sp. AS23.2 TaxID=1680155 RepID=UPI0014304216|nr:hypothetical protein [Bradyrhizobium sp. AS23.2]